MKFSELKAKLEAKGYSGIDVTRWKNHDWLLFKHPPGITYGRLIPTSRVEDVPESTWDKLFTRNTSEKRMDEK